MSRNSPEARSSSRDFSASQKAVDSSAVGAASAASPSSGGAWDFWALRAFLIGCLAALCYVLGPFGLRGWTAASAGFAIALVVLLVEQRLRRAAVKELVGGALGTVVGMVAALLVTLILSRTSEAEPTKSFLEFLSLLAFGYLGLALGSLRGPELGAGRSSAASVAVQHAPLRNAAVKLLDTSVLIDGRIADICEAHFLDGIIAVPQFVLHELQMVADSGEALKRQRGRRGLEVLQRIQKMTSVEVRILDDEPMQSADVDHKLVELARRLGAKVVTNDFNLNKVATVQGITVLNVNQLANALKPAVLPGEPMRVLILREGKEASQGVAYLDDGTMVVVDGARKMLNKSVDVIVTSVHQTTAGKMIFGRLAEAAGEVAGASKPNASAAAAGRSETTGNG
jgi:uncharacterized protein YacL